MKDIEKKAVDDELNESAFQDIGQGEDCSCIRVPRMVRCIECKRLFDLNSEGTLKTSNGYICPNCLK